MSLGFVTVLGRIAIRWFSYGYGYYVSSHMSQVVVVTRIVRSKGWHEQYFYIYME